MAGVGAGAGASAGAGTGKPSEFDYQLESSLKQASKELDTTLFNCKDLLSKINVKFIRVLKDVAQPHDLISLGCEGETPEDRAEVANELNAAFVAFNAVNVAQYETNAATDELKLFATRGKAPPDGISFVKSFLALRTSSAPSGKGLRQDFRKLSEQELFAGKFSETVKIIKAAIAKHGGDTGKGAGAAAAANGLDEDVSLGTQTKEDKARSYKCPIGKGVMKEPMKNKCVMRRRFVHDWGVNLSFTPPPPPIRSCPHIYDKANIFSLITASGKENIVCPVVGCGQTVVKATLVLDEVLLADIEQWEKLRSKIAEAEEDDDEPPTQVAVAAAVAPASKKRTRVVEDEE